MIPTLDTPRLILREFREADFADYARLCADADVMRYLGAGQPWTVGEAWRHFAFMIGHWHLRGYGPWAVEDRESGHFIGRRGPGVSYGAHARHCRLTHAGDDRKGGVRVGSALT